MSESIMLTENLSKEVNTAAQSVCGAAFYVQKKASSVKYEANCLRSEPRQTGL